MKRQFAIGYLLGGMMVLALGAAGSLVIAIFLRRSVFLWIGLVLELLILPIWARKNDLEKQ